MLRGKLGSRPRRLFTLACLGALGLGLGYRLSGLGEEGKPRKVAPLSLDGFMDETLPNAPKATPKLKVDNGACYVCHGNYETETLVVSHGEKKIGCVDCHGQSVDHRNDEDNITPPDIMYPADRIDLKCGECHTEHDVPGSEVVERWQQRCPEKTNPQKIVCTDCHFEHRLKARVVQWDKTTRELIIRKAEAAKTTKGVSPPSPNSPLNPFGR